MKELKIATYNIRKAVGLDRRRDPARILRVLNDLDADVVVLQEVDKRLGRRPSVLPPALIRSATEYTPVDHAGSDVSLGWHGNAILFRNGLCAADPVRLDLPGMEPRGAIRVQIDDFVIVGTHLGLMRNARRQQMQEIRDRLSGDAPRAIIAGDFNEWSGNRGFEPWSPTFAVTRPGASFHARRPLARLDGFATGQSVRIAGARVHQSGEAVIASDHFPVSARILLAPRHGVDPTPS